MANRIENHFCGMLVVYKEPGYTSSDVVAKLRGILHMKKIGHTGTLDPMAEGVLPVCLGNGTRVAELIADRDKEYIARMRLGVTTDTQDMTGKVLGSLDEEEIIKILSGYQAGRKMPASVGSESDHDNCEETVHSDYERVWSSRRNHINENDIAADSSDRDDWTAINNVCTEAVSHAVSDRICAAAARFEGEIDQIPPMYSAIWSNGRRLYDLAREGKVVERKPRRVTIHEIEIQKVELPYVTMRVVCSKGTYIRTLCEDIGKVLGTGAAMDHLLRTRVGIFTLDQALHLDELQRMTDDDLLKAGILPDTSRKSFPEEERKRVHAIADEMQRGRDRIITANDHGGRDSLTPEYSSDAAARAASIHWSVKDHIIPIDALFADKPAVHVQTKDLKYLRNGNALSAGNLTEQRLPHADCIRVYDERGRFYALYRYVSGRNRILPLKMFIDTDSN